jgi:hypothetical protein
MLTTGEGSIGERIRDGEKESSDDKKVESMITDMLSNGSREGDGGMAFVHRLFREKGRDVG